MQRPSIPRSFTSRGSAPRPRSAVALLVVSGLTAVWAAAMLSPFGNLLHAYMFVFTTFYAGPVTLVSLSLTVMAGLVATDRIVLLIRHRVLLQSAHRSLGIIAVFGLVLHVMTKITAGYVRPSTAFLPFISGNDVYVGLGTIAAFLMVSVLWTGLVRARFVGVGRPWMWRALHSTAYLAWPVALVHGLNAGRPAAAWVTVSYLLCVALVIAALLVRLSVSLGRRREEQGQTTGSMAPVGRPGRAGAAGRGAPAGAGRRRTADEIRAGRRTADEIRAGRRTAEEIRAGRGETEDAPRTGRRAAGVPRRDALDGADRDLRAGRGRRESLDDLRGDASGAIIDSWARAGEDETGEFSRRRSERFAVPEVPTPAAGGAGPDRREQVTDWELPWDSPRRWAGGAPDEQWDGLRGREDDDAPYRRPEPADDDAFAEGGRAAGRRRRDVDEDEPPVEPTRARRRAAETGPDRPAERPSRHGKDDDEAESTGGWGRAARYDPQLSAATTTDDEDDDTPTLVDLASRRARRAPGSGRSSRRRQADEAAEEGAYWTKLKGEAQ
ncbi:hypothetical protein [Plantactinospora sp. CA-290183]|uniref:hypothetical protein n=1 Tax=Plantactinospora sp. CA-290183 TaxID=3240006 RepID=UPI003D9141EC